MTYLDRIILRHRELAGADDRFLEDLLVEAAAVSPTRGFRAALTGPGLGVIAEIKRRSPSQGDLAAHLDPAELARSYANGGAAAVSVLTDAEFFAGSATDLGTARDAISIPVLRKDFTVDPRDVVDARLMGADCILLIAAVLDEIELVAYQQLAVSLGMDALVEVHDEPELEIALVAGATLIGVNQRDLLTFEVDHERALRVVGAIPADVTKVAESGIGHADDARRLADAGFDAVLVGEMLVTASDPAGAVASLLTP